MFSQFGEWDRQDRILEYTRGVVDGIGERFVQESADFYSWELEICGELPKCQREVMADVAVDAVVDHNLGVRARKIGELITIHHDS